MSRNWDEISIIERFKEANDATGCDQVSAAILVLAHAVESASWRLQIADREGVVSVVVRGASGTTQE